MYSRQECQSVPQQVCETVPSTQCSQVQEQECSQVPSTVCDQSQEVTRCEVVHKQVPQRVSRQVARNTCQGDSAGKNHLLHVFTDNVVFD